MTEERKKNKQLLLNLQKLMNRQFKNLGDIVGDFLVLIEVNRAAINKRPRLIREIRVLINKCAEDIDIVINKHKLSTVNETTDLVQTLLTDLDKQQVEKEAF